MKPGAYKAGTKKHLPIARVATPAAAHAGRREQPFTTRDAAVLRQALRDEERSPDDLSP